MAAAAWTQQPPANPFTSTADAALGARLFQTHCSYCHGARGEGGRGPDLTLGRYKRGGSDAELFATVRNGIPGTEMAQVQATDDEVWRMIAFVRTLAVRYGETNATGDPVAGRALYEKHKCAACHAIGPAGGSLGPELDMAARRLSRAGLVEALVRPGADIQVPYRAIEVVTKKGETVRGIRLNEDDISIQIRDMSDKPRSFLKSEVRDIRRSLQPLMPSFGEKLNPREIDNLVAYLISLRDLP